MSTGYLLNEPTLKVLVDNPMCTVVNMLAEHHEQEMPLQVRTYLREQNLDVCIRGAGIVFLTKETRPEYLASMLRVISIMFGAAYSEGRELREERHSIELMQQALVLKLEEGIRMGINQQLLIEAAASIIRSEGYDFRSTKDLFAQAIEEYLILETDKDRIAEVLKSLWYIPSDHLATILNRFLTTRQETDHYLVTQGLLAFAANMETMATKIMSGSVCLDLQKLKSESYQMLKIVVFNMKHTLSYEVWLLVESIRRNLLSIAINNPEGIDSKFFRDLNSGLFKSITVLRT